MSSLGELTTEFRTREDDLRDPPFWSDPELAVLFSEAECEAAIRARLIRDSEEIDVDAGDPLVLLPDGLFDIQYAELRAADGSSHEITATSRLILDAEIKGWRTKMARPTRYVHDDKTLLLGSAVDQAYVLYIEFFRLPKRKLESAGDIPEINEIHHAGLIDWVAHRAYAKPDAETFSPGKSKAAEEAFERYFGTRQNADLRRKQNANRPHRNRAHW